MIECMVINDLLIRYGMFVCIVLLCCKIWLNNSIVYIRF